MSWNHRVMRLVHNDDEPCYGIHEVYYHDDGTLHAYTADPVSVVGEDVESLERTLRRMLAALSKPVLSPSDFAEKAEAERQERYDEMTRKAGADPATHACPHGASCAIHG